MTSTRLTLGAEAEMVTQCRATLLGTFADYRRGLVATADVRASIDACREIELQRISRLSQHIVDSFYAQKLVNMNPDKPDSE